MDPESVLMELGLSRNETIVYMSLLKSGPCTATALAESSSIHRPNVYDAVERLVNRGFASFYTQDRRRFFSASDPDNLLHLVREKEQRLRQLLPRLELEKQLSTAETSAEVFKGIIAFRRCLENLLSYRKTIYAFGIPAFVPDVVRNFISHFHKRRISERILMVHIYNEDAKERIAYLNSLEFTEAAYLPKRFDSPATTFVCGDEMMFVNWKPLTFVRIVNSTLAESYCSYCGLLLESAKKSI